MIFYPRREWTSLVQGIIIFFMRALRERWYTLHSFPFFFFFSPLHQTDLKSRKKKKSCAELSKLLLFSRTGNMKGRISQSPECTESEFGFYRELCSSRVISARHIHWTHERARAHKRSSVTKKNAQTRTKRGVCCLPVPLWTCHTVCPPLRPSVTTAGVLSSPLSLSLLSPCSLSVPPCIPRTHCLSAN